MAEAGRTSAAGGQLALARAVASARGRGRQLPAASEPAAVDPVARVVVDVGHAHLDRPFEYSVPAVLADLAMPGVRVRVRFAGQDVDGFVVQRLAAAEHEGPLSPLRKIVSPEPVLTARLLALARAVADRYAGTLGDVLRLAIPPRHAAAERALALATEPAPGIRAPDPLTWGDHPAGRSFLRRLAAGEAPAASFAALPGQQSPMDWPAALATAAATALSGGRGALIVVPDQRDVDRVDAALRAALGPGQHVGLTAGQGPQARYTAWLKVLRGHVRCVVGTRAAMFAPVHDLGLLACWDDGDDLLAEPRAPYPHAREVLALRARAEHAAMLFAGFAQTVRVQQWVEHGLVRRVAPSPSALRRAAPRVVVAGEDDAERDGVAARAHLPSVAWRTAKAALERGPVLVQVPRRGYLPSLSCQDCRAAARCPACHGPLSLGAVRDPPSCRWCGLVVRDFACLQCGQTRLRSSVVGARRTAEELGRAFPGVPVRTSSSGEVHAVVDDRPSLVISTPGAEPVAHQGYAATLLLDAWALLDRPTLDAGQEALRRWLGAAALTRGVSAGGVVVLCGAPTHITLPAVEALVRWDPGWFAARELAERTQLDLPPAVVMAELVGSRPAVEQALGQAALPEAVTWIGPMPYPGDPPVRPQGPDRTGDGQPRAHVLLRAAPDGRAALAAALQSMRAIRSARKEAESVLVRMDPADLG